MEAARLRTSRIVWLDCSELAQLVAHIAIEVIFLPIPHPEAVVFLTISQANCHRHLTKQLLQFVERCKALHAGLTSLSFHWSYIAEAFADIFLHVVQGPLVDRSEVHHGDFGGRVVLLSSHNQCESTMESKPPTRTVSTFTRGFFFGFFLGSSFTIFKALGEEASGSTKEKNKILSLHAEGSYIKCYPNRPLVPKRPSMMAAVTCLDCYYGAETTYDKHYLDRIAAVWFDDALGMSSMTIFFNCKRCYDRKRAIMRVRNRICNMSFELGACAVTPKISQEMAVMEHDPRVQAWSILLIVTFENYAFGELIPT
ncbi:hypothetical protein VNO77_03018 [Canavalia gladiata]|uniref:Uncharacterized protein n=1 Tax=Canavalia gladiata TaxID=3824 RepID=A0AAN9R3H7_CANGL